jgi:hypothetical protein
MTTVKVEGWFIDSAIHDKTGPGEKITAEFPEHVILYELHMPGKVVDKKKVEHEYVGTIFFHPDEAKFIPYGFRVTRHVGRVL